MTNSIPLLGHPRALFVLFAVEVWERFSFYGMRALLVFYLTQHWNFTDARAFLAYSCYGALIATAPLLGGYLADRWLGPHRAVRFGAILLTAGHCLLAIEGGAEHSAQALEHFWLALAFVIVGVGFLKPNISVLIGQLYDLQDRRRDAGFTVFYVGINLGAASGALVAGYLGQTHGWAYGFGAAGVGMVGGMFILFSCRSLLVQAMVRTPEPTGSSRTAKDRQGYLLGLAAVIAVWGLVQAQFLVGLLLATIGALILAVMLYTALRSETVTRHRVLALLFLFALQPVFGALLEQGGSSLSIYTDRYVERTLFGFEVPASMFQALNPIYIVLLGPVFAWLWPVLARHRLEPSTPAKFGLAIAQIGVSYLVLWHMGSADSKTHIAVILLVYLLHATGELCIGPIGLSVTTRMSPSDIAGLMMGTWFLAGAAGSYAAGMLASIAGRAGTAYSSNAPSPLHFLELYAWLGWVAIAIAVVVLALSPWARRLMHETPTDTPGARTPGT